VTGQPHQDAAVRYCGRVFTAAELDAVRTLAGALPTRARIAEALCDALDWRRPDGRRKDMSARVALLRMADDGLLTLPAPRNTNGNGRIPRRIEPGPQLPLPVSASLARLGPIELRLVDTPAQSKLWRTLIATHHYLGYTPLAGAQLRYLVQTPHGIVAALAFAASAWKCAPRDAHIGWDPATRAARLHLVVNNARFLILPHVRVPNLASFLLAQVTRRIRVDWQTAYRYQPVLIETFVEADRFAGASYRAANWTHVGRTKGRGKLDRHHAQKLPVKDVYLYPLHRAYRRVLAGTD